MKLQQKVKKSMWTTFILSGFAVWELINQEELLQE